jgi:phage regulator Rha-like protein
MYLLVVEGKPVMDSRDIATLTKKQHAHVLRDIKELQGKLKDASIFGGIYIDRLGREKPLFKLPYRETMLLLTGYSVELRAKVIDRWIALEKKMKKSYGQISAYMIIWASQDVVNLDFVS